MQEVNKCFNKVKKDYFKFISSQETKKDKFKNKDKMIKSFLIPVSFWIAKKVNKKKPLIIGLAGGQGSGKTTISSILTLILKKYFKLNVFKVSIDDLRTVVGKDNEGKEVDIVISRTAEIKIIDNAIEQVAFYDLIKQFSGATDLTLIGIPNYKIEQQAEFIVKTNQLFETIGSTLLVKAANNFNVLDLNFIKEKS